MSDCMDIRVLNYFLVVAEEGNITKAAERLLMTQPTLSRQLKALEEELKVALFKRSNHRIYLTEEGLLFQQRARDIVEMTEHAKAELHATEEIKGTLSIGCGELAAMQELSQALAIFQEKHPQVKVALHSGDNDDIRQGIDMGRLDFGLLLEPVDVSLYDFVHLRTKERWGILAHKESDFADKKVIVPGELSGTPVLTILDRTVQRELIAWSGAAAATMVNRGRYNTAYNAVMLARESKGVVIGLDLKQSYPDFTFVPFEPELALSSVLAWRSSRQQSTLVKAFITFFREYENIEQDL
ncbi:LysR family transcriptional regulator [Streptococcus gallolyticus]|uniref:LysR family transcriptional regulator n=1 Tax=Streptococcus gallolyticus TaxID=315405 RepID=UPI002283D1DC|nr:LysR family transcriptional regulator [Streptococcus gallolyticus]MDO4964434.1 LysR family transcriptional regulator [Streptococcus gallolyticus]